MTKIKKIDWDLNCDFLDNEYLDALDNGQATDILWGDAYDLGHYEISYRNYENNGNGYFLVTETPLIQRHYTDVWEESSDSITELMEMCQKDFESIISYCIED